MTTPLKLCGSTALALLLAAQASAQVFTPEDEVIVTGQKIERTLQDTKESVAVLNAAVLDDLVLLSLEDALAATANAIAFNNDEAFTLRGITNNEVATSGGPGELATLYIDGVAYTGRASVFGPRDLWDVESVEIFRGPQSTNVGRNALAGAIVLNTARPVLGAFGGAVRGQLSNFDTYGLEGLLNVPVGDTAALRLTGEYLESDGFVDNVVLDEEADPRENLALRGRLLWEPRPDVSVLLSGQYLENSRGNDTFRADLTGATSREASADFPSFNDYDGVTAALDVTWDIDEAWSVRSISSLLSGEGEREFDADGSPTGGEIETSSGSSDDDNIAQELRLNYNGDRLRGVMGLYYIDLQIDDITQGFFVVDPATAGVPEVLLPFYAPSFPVGVNRTTELEQENFALFTQFEFDVTDRLTVSAGLRYDTEDQSTAGSVTNALIGGVTLPDPQDFTDFGPQVVGGLTQVNAVLESQLVSTVFEPADTSFDVFLPEVGLTFALSESTNIAAFYKRGYRSGGVQISTGGQQDFFEPEFLDNFELSLRHTSSDRRWVVNANAYYGIWTDQQLSVPVNGSIFLRDIENAGRSLIGGFEVETQFRPSDRLTLFASLGYAETQFDEFCLTGSPFTVDAPACVAEGVAGVDLDGFDFARSPDWSGAIGGRFDITDALFVSGNINYRDTNFSQIENIEAFENDSAVLANARIGYAWDEFEIAAFGRNIFDEDYSDFRGPTGLGGDTFNVTLGAPAQYGLLITKRFGGL